MRGFDVGEGSEDRFVFHVFERHGESDTGNDGLLLQEALDGFLRVGILVLNKVAVVLVAPESISGKDFRKQVEPLFVCGRMNDRKRGANLVELSDLFCVWLH